MTDRGDPSTQLLLATLSSASSARFLSFAGEICDSTGLCFESRSAPSRFFVGDLSLAGEGEGLFASSGARARRGEAIVRRCSCSFLAPPARKTKKDV